MALAYLLYSRAAALKPAKELYWLRSQAVQSRAALEAKVKPTLPDRAPADAAESSTQFDSISAKELAEARQPLPPSELKPTPGLKDFDLRGNPKALFESVAKSFGLDCVFDGDYPEGRAFRFQIQNADYRDALRTLEAATGSFIVPLTDRLFLVAKDTQQKRNEVEPVVAITIPFPEPGATQDLLEAASAVRQALNIERLAVDSKSGMILFKDHISKIAPARQLFEEITYYRAEMELEVELVEVNRNHLLNLGIDLPVDFPVVYLSKIWNSNSSIPAGIARLALLGGGKSLFGIGVVNARVIANMSRSSGRTVLRAQLRSLNGQQANFHAGNRYPILTGGYFGQPNIPPGSRVFAPPPSFNFEDLGLVVKFTPHIHGMEEISLDLDAEFKVLSGTALNGIPVISQRRLESKIRVRNGEWAVLAGMLSSAQARAISGIPGISGLPLLGAALSKHSRTRDETEILIIVKPRILSVPPSEMLNRGRRFGSETRPITPL